MLLEATGVDPVIQGETVEEDRGAKDGSWGAPGSKDVQREENSQETGVTEVDGFRKAQVAWGYSQQDRVGALGPDFAESSLYSWCQHLLGCLRHRARSDHHYGREGPGLR